MSCKTGLAALSISASALFVLGACSKGDNPVPVTVPPSAPQTSKALRDFKDISQGEQMAYTLCVTDGAKRGITELRATGSYEGLSVEEMRQRLKEDAADVIKGAAANCAARLRIDPETAPAVRIPL